MAAPERFADRSDSSCTAGAVHTWPYASTLFDYIRRAMPFNAPQSLTADQVYAVSAYILYLNNIVTEDTVLDATSLPRVEMPNRNGLTSPDPRPDVP